MLPPDKIEEIKKSSAELGRETEFAYLLDHLEEERRQGITIDTTQVFFKTERREYVIIDAPGHVEFVKNMITGASQAEAAVLIVDVVEGIRQQTTRHAYILSLLGLDQVIAVLNKMDRVGYDQSRFNAVKYDVENFLTSIHVTPTSCIPISALRGDNITSRSADMKWYEGPTFLESLDTLKNTPSPAIKPLLFPIQDIYEMEEQRIAVGRIEAGELHVRQAVKVLPSGETTRIQTIEKFPSRIEKAIAGESIGVTIEDPLFLNRGDVLCRPNAQPALTDTFEATIIWLSKSELNESDRIGMRCATQETTAKVQKISERIDSSTLDIIEKDADKLKNLEVGRLLLETKKPMVIKSFNDVREFGRFVFVRDNDICAGGIIASEEWDEERTTHYHRP
jgi:translation elongation factor TU